MGPAFDYNFGSGNTTNPGWGYPDWFSKSNAWYSKTAPAYGWYRRMLEDPDYKVRYADKWFEHREDKLSDAQVNADINYYYNSLRYEGAVRNFSRWDILNSWVECNYYYGTVGDPHNYQMETDWFRNWFTGGGVPSDPCSYDPEYSDRLDWMDTHFGYLTGTPYDWNPYTDHIGVGAPPTISLNSSPANLGGYADPCDTVTLSASSGTIYYTIDGSDPRLWATSGTGGSSDTLVAEDAAKAVLIPTGSVNNNWKGGGSFNDSSWNDYTYISGRTGGVGYERSSGYETHISYDVESWLYDNNDTGSCFIRIQFFVDGGDLPSYDDMTLSVRFDDAFVAYINGTEVARSSLTPASPDWDSWATDYTDPETSSLIEFDITGYLGELSSGNNILAIHGLNYGTTSSDFLISAKLVASDTGSGSSGAISPSAIAYSGPSTLTESTKIITRSKDGSDWTAKNKATFAVGPVASNLRITELMYHPTDPNDEFIELKNIGASSIDLAWCKFTDGVEYTFPSWTLAAGDYALVVRKQSEFVKHYPTAAAKVVGEYTGYALSNGGEEIVLKDAAGTEIHDFDYNDWYPVTDGYNFSLCIIDPASTDPNDWDEKEGWQASNANGGSPGAANPANVQPNGAIVINEVLTHTDDVVDGDWIELHNTTGSPIDIGGWFLSDDFDNLKRYEIASGISIPANGYKVFTSVANFRNAGDSGSHVQFGLSELGEEVFLSSGSGAYGGDLTGGYSITENFGASENDVTFGRYVKSAASGYNVDFVSMQSATKEAVNSGPLVPDVVISEIMYNSSAVQDQLGEFIELKNRTGSVVQLYDPCNPDNTWKFTKGIDFTFPTGITMTAGEHILIVRTAPEIFRSNHSLSPSLQIFGPFENHTELQNSGEKIELSMPGNPEPGGFVPYIRAEQVNYSDGSHPVGDDPWPTDADGNGDSLNRKVDGDYGNDIDNWQAASPTPGS
jgi:hypothetical protein